MGIVVSLAYDTIINNNNNIVLHITLKLELKQHNIIIIPSSSRYHDSFYIKHETLKLCMLYVCCSYSEPKRVFSTALYFEVLPRLGKQALRAWNQDPIFVLLGPLVKIGTLLQLQR